ncbi:hypothetical protein M409DRAFT_20651 [Zasmidium cellare ATCC 36951]|uniref:Secreted protein n=1 Tax=Zasmidium cellare ATCC 36951 TaxID=1080233 RepID=A0A6A6CUD6_ZASCE|nr:uncharacterized protein M409DRAFT_20651 [Zasmidium cellare ATCC 36951]KAF2169432.1 hypothetical protein M409DRAFT_20651 [Zasmidium cellare ATCC 36951]
MFRLSAVAVSLACLTPTTWAQASEYTIQWWGDYHCGYNGDTGQQLTDGNPWNKTYTGSSLCAWFYGFEGTNDPDNYHSVGFGSEYFGSFQLTFTGPGPNGQLHPAVFTDDYCQEGLPEPEAAFTLNAGTLGTIDTPGCYTLPGKPAIQGYSVTQDGA